MPTDSYSDSAVTSSVSESSSTAGGDFASFRVLSEHDRAAIVALMENKVRIKLAQGQVREDAKAVAERLGMKPSELNTIVRLAMREREQGNVLAHQKALIEVAEQLTR